MTTLLFHTWALVSGITAVTPLDTRALIEQALDEPAAITLDNVRLGDAIELLTEQTGVKLAMSPDVMAFVPHGADTLIEKVDIANLTLRQGLTELFSPLGMTFVVRDDDVEIVPKEALLCLGRPPTWPELDSLARLSALQPGTDEGALAGLQSRVQFQVPVRGAWNVLADAIRNVGAGPGNEVLTTACAQLGWAWCLSEEWIVVTPMQEQIRRRLLQPVSLRINSRPLIDVLHALGERVNVKIRTEPGALASLPLYMQRGFSVNVVQLPAEQVLETIAASTGLGYLLEPDGVLFYRPVGGVREAPDGTGSSIEGVVLSDPYVATIEVQLDDGTTVRWLVRLSELPDDLRQMRAGDIKAMIEALRRRPAPTTP